jgi:hypothetical protein
MFQVNMNLLYSLLLTAFSHCVLSSIDPKNVRCLGKIISVFNFRYIDICLLRTLYFVSAGD